MLGYATFMVMMATGRFAGDRIIARVGRKKILQLSGLLVLTGLMIAVLFPYLITATLGFLIVGFGVSSVIPTIYSTAARSAKIRREWRWRRIEHWFPWFSDGPPLIGYIAQIPVFDILLP